MRGQEDCGQIRMIFLFLIGLISFCFTLSFTPLVRSHANRWGLMDRPGAARKLHTKPIARAGGIVILLSCVLSTCLAEVLFHPFEHGESIQSPLVLLAAVLIIFGTGLADDRFGLKPWHKLAGETVAAFLAYRAGIEVHLFRGTPFDDLLVIPITILWLVICSNAFNLIDGMDGLASGLGVCATLTVLVAALLLHNMPLAFVAMPLLGSLLGFLRFNFSPASIFLGDCGSLLIGFVLACCGALWGEKSTTLLGLSAPVMALSIPLLDTILAIMRRWVRNRPLFSADRGHMHHRMLEKGLSPRDAALVFYVGGAIASLFSICAQVIRNQYTGIIAIVFCLAAAALIYGLKYAEFSQVKRVILQGTIFEVIDGRVRLEEFARELNRTADDDEYWEVLVRYGGEFGFSKLRWEAGSKVREALLSADVPSWRLQVPLSGDGKEEKSCLHLHRPLNAPKEAPLLSELVNVARAGFTSKVLTTAALSVSTGDARRAELRSPLITGGTLAHSTEGLMSNDGGVSPVIAFTGSTPQLSRVDSNGTTIVLR
jgi:UDP-GlcNAc:undecaprenyl-phosphate/decaprenyl-phosphate GlcNAc-1-phosphate transferase